MFLWVSNLILYYLEPNEDCFGILKFEATEKVIDDKTFVKGTIKPNKSGAIQTTVIEKECSFQTWIVNDVPEKNPLKGLHSF